MRHVPGIVFGILLWLLLVLSLWMLFSSLPAHGGTYYAASRPHLLAVDGATIEITAEVTYTAPVAVVPVAMQPLPATPVQHGQTIRRKLTIRNTTDKPITRITAWVRLPASVDYVSLSASVTGKYIATSRTIQWYVSTINPGVVVVRSWKIKVK